MKKVWKDALLEELEISATAKPGNGHGNGAGHGHGNGLGHGNRPGIIFPGSSQDDPNIDTSFGVTVESVSSGDYTL